MKEQMGFEQIFLFGKLLLNNQHNQNTKNTPKDTKGILNFQVHKPLEQAKLCLSCSLNVGFKQRELIWSNNVKMRREVILYFWRRYATAHALQLQLLGLSPFH